MPAALSWATVDGFVVPSPHVLPDAYMDGAVSDVEPPSCHSGAVELSARDWPALEAANSTKVSGRCRWLSHTEKAHGNVNDQVKRTASGVEPAKIKGEALQLSARDWPVLESANSIKVTGQQERSSLKVKSSAVGYGNVEPQNGALEQLTCYWPLLETPDAVNVSQTTVQHTWSPEHDIDNGGADEEGSVAGTASSVEPPEGSAQQLSTCEWPALEVATGQFSRSGLQDNGNDEGSGNTTTQLPRCHTNGQAQRGSCTLHDMTSSTSEQMVSQYETSSQGLHGTEMLTNNMQTIIGPMGAPFLVKMTYYQGRHPESFSELLKHHYSQNQQHLNEMNTFYMQNSLGVDYWPHEVTHPGEAVGMYQPRDGCFSLPGISPCMECKPEQNPVSPSGTMQETQLHMQPLQITTGDLSAMPISRNTLAGPHPLTSAQNPQHGVSSKQLAQTFTEDLQLMQSVEITPEHSYLSKVQQSGLPVLPDFTMPPPNYCCPAADISSLETPKVGTHQLPPLSEHGVETLSPMPFSPPRLTHLGSPHSQVRCVDRGTRAHSNGLFKVRGRHRARKDSSKEMCFSKKAALTSAGKVGKNLEDEIRVSKDVDSFAPGNACHKTAEDKPRRGRHTARGFGTGRGSLGRRPHRPLLPTTQEAAHA